MDPELYHVFMNNNIFFSYAVDGRKIYGDLGGDQVLISFGLNCPSKAGGSSCQLFV